MKSLKAVWIVIMVTAVSLAFSVPAFAIGFSAEEVYESVFVIYSGNALGSGFSIGTNCVITNAHVIDDSSDVVVKSYSGQEYAATVIGMDVDQDVAVLSVSGAAFPYLTVADAASMNIGDDIYAIGAPKSMSYTLTKGVISAKEREIGRYTYIQIDAAINEGNSGGPLLNDNGQVLGVNTMKMTDSEGIGLAIPMQSVTAYVTSLGINLNETGNVVGDVQTTAPSQEPSPTPEEHPSRDEEPEEDGEELSMITVIAVGVAVISLIVNAVLVAALMTQKRKTVTETYDPRERTDFEIDILE